MTTNLEPHITCHTCHRTISLEECVEVQSGQLNHAADVGHIHPID